MKVFKCQSCGSSNTIQTGKQKICAYCQSELIEEKSSLSSKKIFYILVIALLFSSMVVYALMQEEDAPQVKDNPKQALKTLFETKVLNNSDALSNIKNLNYSRLSIDKKVQRDKKFTQWLSKSEYQTRFNNGYYKKYSIYPAYVELDSQGNRRTIEIEYEPRFYWSVTSGRLFRDFQREHVKHIMNGKKLLTMSVIIKQGIELYTGTWISSTQFERESKKLASFGIYPPQLKFKSSNTLLVDSSLTQVKVSLITANSKDADTKGRIFLAINSDEAHSYLLDKPQYKDHALGATDTYHFNIEYPIEKIHNIKLFIEGVDAWKMEYFSLQFIQKDAYSKRYVLNSNQWFSQEQHDIDKLGAISEYVFKTDAKVYTKEKAPTVYLSAIVK